MEREDRFVAELRALWQSVEVPPLSRALEDEDDATRASVEWMQRAWRQVECPPMPRRLPRRVSHFERLRQGLSLAAAAAILIAFARIIYTIPIAQVELETAAVPAEPLIVDNSNPDQVELRSGPVRVLWLNN